MTSAGADQDESPRRLARRLTRSARNSARDPVDLAQRRLGSAHFSVRPVRGRGGRAFRRARERARSGPPGARDGRAAPALPPAPGLFGASFARARPRDSSSSRRAAVAPGRSSSRARAAAGPRPRRAEALARAAPDPRETEAEAEAAAAAGLPPHLANPGRGRRRGWAHASRRRRVGRARPRRRRRDLFADLFLALVPPPRPPRHPPRRGGRGSTPASRERAWRASVRPPRPGRNPPRRRPRARQSQAATPSRRRAEFVSNEEKTVAGRFSFLRGS